MITLLISLLFVAYLIGLAAMIRAMKRSPVGYEDELGFHAGNAEIVEFVAETIEFSSERKLAA